MDWKDEDGKDAFSGLIDQQPAPGLLAEFWMFLSYNKKWWLLPILGLFLIIGALLFLSSTPLAPFIYTMF